MKADLHMHSVNSDGELTVDLLIERALIAKLDVMALSDHDSISGVREITKLAKEKGIRVITALELSTYTNKEPIHVLAYFNELSEQQFNIVDYLIMAHEEREARMKKMIENVKNEYGIEIDFNKVKAKHRQLVRPHLAKEMAKILGISIDEVFKNYIGNDSKVYVESVRLSTIDGIKMIHDAHGIAILAHPYNIKKSDPFDIIKMGVDGVEVFYAPASKDEWPKFYNYCIENNLLMTGGSDFHRDNDPKHSPIGSSPYGGIELDKFLKRIDELK